MHHPWKFGGEWTSNNLDTGPVPKTLTRSDAYAQGIWLGELKTERKRKKWKRIHLFVKTKQYTYNKYFPHTINGEEITQKVEIFPFECLRISYSFLKKKRVHIINQFHRIVHM